MFDQAFLIQGIVESLAHARIIKGGEAVVEANRRRTHRGPRAQLGAERVVGILHPLQRSRINADEVDLPRFIHRQRQSRTQFIEDMADQRRLPVILVAAGQDDEIVVTPRLQLKGAGAVGRIFPIRPADILLIDDKGDGISEFGQERDDGRGEAHFERMIVDGAQAADLRRLAGHLLGHAGDIAQIGQGRL